MPMYRIFPSSFHPLNVLRWVCQSTRLWTCMRSICFLFNRENDSFICLIPFSLPLVQTFVAINKAELIPAWVESSPTTFSELPYMGELSITLPPFSRRFFKTESNGSRSEGESPTSNVRQVPTPIAGRRSPVEGIVRINKESAIDIHAGRAAKKPKPDKLV